MTQSPPSADHPAPAAVVTAAREKRWLRFAALLVLAQTTLFYQGCDNKYVISSLGPAGPWATFGIHESLWSSKPMDFSPALLGVNLLLVAAAVLLVARLPPPWFERLTSRSLLVAAAIATSIFNSILFLAGVWIYLVAIPINWLAETFFSSFSNYPAVVLGSLSRAYYLLGVGVIAGALQLVQMLLRKYLFIHADRWQVSLGGLLVLMALLGTGIGMLLRLFR